MQNEIKAAFESVHANDAMKACTMQFVSDKLAKKQKPYRRVLFNKWAVAAYACLLHRRKRRDDIRYLLRNMFIGNSSCVLVIIQPGQTGTISLPGYSKMQISSRGFLWGRDGSEVRYPRAMTESTS